MKSLPVLADNQDPAVCVPCGGLCCRNSPGYLWPEQLGETEEARRARLIELLQSGLWQLATYESSWDDEPDVLCLRPATADTRGQYYAPDGGRCTFLGPTGCRLSWDERPMQCRALRPRRHPEARCSMTDGFVDWDAAQAWLPLQDMIASVLEQLLGVPIRPMPSDGV